MLPSAYDQLQRHQIDYNYTARAILLTEASQDQKYIKSMLDFLLLDERQNFYCLNGVSVQFGQFVLIHVEGKIDALVRFLATLQPYCQRQSELDPSHPLAVASKSRTQAFKRTVVLLFEENIRPTISTFRHLQTSVLKNDITQQQTLVQQVCHTVASMLKLTAVVNLSLGCECDSLEAVLQLHDELPNMQNLARILGLGDLEAQQIKTVPSLKTADQSLSAEALAKMQQVDDAYDAYMREENTPFKMESDGVMELDEFVYDLLLCNKVELVEEAGNLNENWVYENLKHILGK